MDRFDAQRLAGPGRWRGRLRLAGLRPACVGRRREALDLDGQASLLVKGDDVDAARARRCPSRIRSSSLRRRDGRRWRAGRCLPEPLGHGDSLAIGLCEVPRGPPSSAAKMGDRRAPADSTVRFFHFGRRRLGQRRQMRRPLARLATDSSARATAASRMIGRSPAEVSPGTSIRCFRRSSL